MQIQATARAKVIKYTKVFNDDVLKRISERGLYADLNNLLGNYTSVIEEQSVGLNDLEKQLRQPERGKFAGRGRFANAARATKATQFWNLVAPRRATGDQRRGGTCRSHGLPPLLQTTAQGQGHMCKRAQIVQL